MQETRGQVGFPCFTEARARELFVQVSPHPHPNPNPALAYKEEAEAPLGCDLFTPVAFQLGRGLEGVNWWVGLRWMEARCTAHRMRLGVAWRGLPWRGVHASVTGGMAVATLALRLLLRLRRCVLAWTICTSTASCTVTSSLPTCCWRPTETSRSATSARPGKHARASSMPGHAASMVSSCHMNHVVPGSAPWWSCIALLELGLALLRCGHAPLLLARQRPLGVHPTSKGKLGSASLPSLYTASLRRAALGSLCGMPASKPTRLHAAMPVPSDLTLPSSPPLLPT